MKALVYTAPNELVYRDEPEPPYEAGEVLVRVEAVGICGSDMHAYHGRDPRRVPPHAADNAFDLVIDMRKLTLADGAAAFRDLHEGRSAAAKIVLRP